MSSEGSPDRLRRPEAKGGRLSRLGDRSQPSPSPGTPRRSRPSPRPIEILHKCSSEPLIFPATGDGDDSGLDCRSPDSGKGCWFGRLNTFNDFLLLSPLASPLGRNTTAGYDKDAKVVITVTMEGSPGPIRSLVKLGTIVDDVIKLVIQRYGEEGRLPQLAKDAASSFDLHLSYFSFQCLDRSTTIGDIGSRGFYLRKSNDKKRHKLESIDTSEIVSITGNSPKQPSPLVVVLPCFITRKVNKMGRRVRKLFKVLGCLHSA